MVTFTIRVLRYLHLVLKVLYCGTGTRGDVVIMTSSEVPTVWLWARIRTLVPDQEYKP